MMVLAVGKKINGKAVITKKIDILGGLYGNKSRRKNHKGN